MKLRFPVWLAFAAAAGLMAACQSPAQYSSNLRAGDTPVGQGPGDQIALPQPFHTPAARNRSKVIGWPAGRTPSAPPGFRVSLYADNLNNPRLIYVLPNEDVLVAESIRGEDRGKIILLRDANKDGAPEVRETFLEGLNRPFGMALVGSNFYVGNTDALMRFPYQSGQTRITAKGEKILDLPEGGHYTRNVIASPDGKKLYVAVGSRTNVDEQNEDAKDPRRAAILEMNPDGSGMRVFASGLRNPVGLAWEPSTKALWTVVNERDGLGRRPGA